MGNVNLPTPVVIAAGVIVFAGGYLTGAVTGWDSPDRTTAVVSSYDAKTHRLCLKSDAVSDLAGAEGNTICGQWERVSGSALPAVGDDFRFVSSVTKGQSGTADDRVSIFGEVAD
ncbi:hypothetical protein [Nocardioides jejuensis]|uniref:Uncharacterized protein n=1 Tax=Nocardioides jejuensis TaxID=2502782 RepID=A0A4V2NZG7_9ACTN|nr:hypothetical protein [Nocardioides jejuensis]TCJ28962.1 hypothetical protein EPD65_07305 [Nocardioides jejuensis]